jgi:hypothetical protein
LPNSCSNNAIKLASAWLSLESNDAVELEAEALAVEVALAEDEPSDGSAFGGQLGGAASPVDPSCSVTCLPFWRKISAFQKHTTERLEQT